MIVMRCGRAALLALLIGWLAGWDPIQTSDVALAATLAMVTEVLGEATEKPASEGTDEIADVYLYRPLGLWLFSDDDRARWIRRTADARMS